MQCAVCITQFTSLQFKVTIYLLITTKKMCFFPTNFYSLFIFPNKIQLKVTVHYKNDGLSVDNHETINNEKLKIFLLQLTNWLKLGFNPKINLLSETKILTQKNFILAVIFYLRHFFSLHKKSIFLNKKIKTKTFTKYNIHNPSNISSCFKVY